MANGDFDPQKIEDFIKKIQNSQNSWKFGAAILGVVIAIAVLGSTFYKIEPQEEGVVRRFGKYIKTTQPGLHFKLPWGIDDVVKVPTKDILKEEFGFQSLQSGSRTKYSQRGHEEISLMLTGDLNIADVSWSVQYRIREPTKFLFAIRDPRGTLRDASEAAMRLVVGDRSIDEVLNRERINFDVKQRLQELMTGYETGIEIVNVALQRARPPDEVRAAFEDVNKAKQERETLINQAREQRNSIIPKAKGEAQKRISSAEGYAIKRTNEAEGDGERFISVYQAYASAPTVVKRRLYIEAMAETLGRLKNVWIVDDKLKNVIPLIQMMRSSSAPGAGK